MNYAENRTGNYEVDFSENYIQRRRIEEKSSVKLYRLFNNLHQRNLNIQKREPPKKQKSLRPRRNTFDAGR